MAKFCQNCKKTYTDGSVAFCEDCGGDLVSLDAGSEQRGGSVLPPPPDEFFDEPPPPLWKKYLPYGVGLAALAILLAVVPGWVRDNVEGNVSAQFDDNSLMTGLRQSTPSVTLKVHNNSSFGVTLERVQVNGTIRNMAVQNNCASGDFTHDLVRGDNSIAVVLCPVDLRHGLEDSDPDAVSGFNGIATFKAWGITINRPVSLTIDDDRVRRAFNLKDKDSDKDKEKAAVETGKPRRPHPAAASADDCSDPNKPLVASDYKKNPCGGTPKSDLANQIKQAAGEIKVPDSVQKALDSINKHN